jgi:hypothetical protein
MSLIDSFIESLLNSIKTDKLYLQHNDEEESNSFRLKLSVSTPINPRTMMMDQKWPCWHP